MRAHWTLCGQHCIRKAYFFPTLLLHIRLRFESRNLLLVTQCIVCHKKNRLWTWVIYYELRTMKMLTRFRDSKLSLICFPEGWGWRQCDAGPRSVPNSDGVCRQLLHLIARHLQCRIYRKSCIQMTRGGLASLANYACNTALLHLRCAV